MTKEEKDKIEYKFKILERYHYPRLNGELKNISDLVSVHAAFSAMEEYAKQECIELLKWFGNLNYECAGYDYITKAPLFYNDNLHNETAETLYDNYLFNKNK